MVCIAAAPATITPPTPTATMAPQLDAVSPNHSGNHSSSSCGGAATMAEQFYWIQRSTSLPPMSPPFAVVRDVNNHRNASSAPASMFLKQQDEGAEPRTTTAMGDGKLRALVHPRDEENELPTTSLTKMTQQHPQMLSSAYSSCHINQPIVVTPPKLLQEEQSSSPSSAEMTTQLSANNNNNPMSASSSPSPSTPLLTPSTCSTDNDNHSKSEATPISPTCVASPSPPISTPVCSSVCPALPLVSNNKNNGEPPTTCASTPEPRSASPTPTAAPTGTPPTPTPTSASTIFHRSNSCSSPNNTKGIIRPVATHAALPRLNSTTSRTTANTRRCIFNKNVWKQNNTTTAAAAAATTPSSSSSCSVPNRPTEMEPQRVTFPAVSTSLFPPRPAPSLPRPPSTVPQRSAPAAMSPRQLRLLLQPPPHRCFNKPHFRPVDTRMDRSFPVGNNSTTNTTGGGRNDPPDLPYPMRRFYQYGPRRTELGGVYPMVSPTPILRVSSYGPPQPKTSSDPNSNTNNKRKTLGKHSSVSFGSSTSSSSSTTTSNDCCDVNELEVFGPDVDVASLNMIDTVRLAEVKQDKKKLSQLLEQQQQKKKKSKSTDTYSTHSLSSIGSHTNREEEDDVDDTKSSSASLALTEKCPNEEKTLVVPAVEEQQLVRRTQSSEQPNENKKVHFDPRVTVTEFEDTFPRYWFSAFELERLQRESVHLVQRYLVTHPSMIMEYNQPRYDPVTGTYRKRALFSIPILRANSTEEEKRLLQDCCGGCGFGSNKGKRSSCAAAESVARSQVQHILIAARNHTVSDLLTRSIQAIFPHAKISAVTTGEEALRIFCDRVYRSQQAKATTEGSEAVGTSEEALSSSGVGAFDLVIADGPLNRSLNHSPAAVSLDRFDLASDMDHGSSHSPSFKAGHGFLCGLRRNASSLTNLRSMRNRHSSHRDHPPPPSSGAELFQYISRITAYHLQNHHNKNSNHHEKKEADGMSVSSLSSSANAVAGSRTVPLLIGLTTSSPKDTEGKFMTECGAGIVWSLPPPKMDEYLRDEIVSKLLQKRTCGSGGGES